MKLSVLSITLLLAGATSAQTVWRCGPDGRSYAQTPCAEGRVVAVADPRSADEVAQARAVAARELALARELVQQRQARDNEALSIGRASARERGPAKTGVPGPVDAQRAKLAKAAKAEPATRKATAPPSPPPAGGGTSPAAARGFPRTTG